MYDIYSVVQAKLFLLTCTSQVVHLVLKSSINAFARPDSIRATPALIGDDLQPVYKPKMMPERGMRSVLPLKTYALWMRLNDGVLTCLTDMFIEKIDRINRKPSQWLKLTLLCQSQRFTPSICNRRRAQNQIWWYVQATFEEFPTVWVERARKSSCSCVKWNVLM